MQGLDVQVRGRVIVAIHRYATEGFGDAKHLRGTSGEYRLRVGDYRVRFALDNARGQMVVLGVAHRREVYR